MPRKRKSARRIRENYTQRAWFVIDANPVLPEEIIRHHSYLDRCSQLVFNHSYDNLKDAQKSRLHEALKNDNHPESVKIRLKLMEEGLVQL